MFLVILGYYEVLNTISDFKEIVLPLHQKELFECNS